MVAAPAPPADPRALRRRSEILSASYRVFAEKGYHATNIADIAAELDIGHGTFYRYFRNKLDIFSHVLDEVIARVTSAIANERPDAPQTLEEYGAQAQRIGQKLFELFLNDERLSRLLFYEALGIDQEVDKKVQHAFDVFGEITKQYLDNGKLRGFLRADLDTRRTALAVNAIVFETVRRVVRSADPHREAAAWITSMTQFVLRGMAT